MTIGGYGTGSSFVIDLPAGASKMLQTDGQGSVATGAAKVTAGSSIGVSAIFSIYDSQGNYLTETGVGSADPQANFVLPVDTTGVFNTGLALFNYSGSDVSYTVTLRGTNGQIAGALAPSTLRSGNHRAIFISGLNQLFPAITNFQGTLLVQCSAPIAATVLRQYQNASTLSYTSLPVVSTASTKQALNLAQVANGGGYQTSFLIFNISASPANVTLTLTNDNGDPLSVTQSRDLGRAPASRVPTLAPNASIFLQTDGSPGSVATGAATIASNVPIGASGVFTVLDSQGRFQTETGVGDSPVLTTMTLPVDITGNFDTAIAFYYPGAATATLTFQLLDANGTSVASSQSLSPGLMQSGASFAAQSASRDIPSKGHLAIFVSQIFPGTSNFRGSLGITSTAGVAALTLRMNNPPLSFTTLPVVFGAATGTTPAAALLYRKSRPG